MASTMLAAQLRTARRTGRVMYDVTPHQQAAMPEQLLVPFPAADPDAELDRLDDKPQKALDMTAVPALKKLRTRTSSRRWPTRPATGWAGTPSAKTPPRRVRCARTTSAHTGPIPTHTEVRKPAVESSRCDARHPPRCARPRFS
ncbi:hypothetical protein [Streptomyces goshikiensis]|uniref:hypothetical protein n=1 Tax=Streptomyces goshikiensis TaxID=1942 RepID=UPI00371E9090